MRTDNAPYSGLSDHPPSLTAARDQHHFLRIQDDVRAVLVVIDGQGVAAKTRLQIVSFPQNDAQAESTRTLLCQQCVETVPRGNHEPSAWLPPHLTRVVVIAGDFEPGGQDISHVNAMPEP